MWFHETGQFRDYRISVRMGEFTHLHFICLLSVVYSVYRVYLSVVAVVFSVDCRVLLSAVVDGSWLSGVAVGGCRRYLVVGSWLLVGGVGCRSFLQCR
jgi:hypothetical protein